MFTKIGGTFYVTKIIFPIEKRLVIKSNGDFGRRDCFSSRQKADHSAQRITTLSVFQVDPSTSLSVKLFMYRDLSITFSFEVMMSMERGEAYAASGSQLCDVTRSVQVDEKDVMI